ncbi:dihydroorotate dehydrogenase [Rubellimicrobium rubrum]|uniref:dihydroorotate dehydrogenase n=1 Tax=Rubellimicrobium rubrum TaxID=2585369 RepID=UPI00159BE118|nr:dihydroorotate dehydrogenase [Rubellimicrobium rubrum]
MATSDRGAPIEMELEARFAEARDLEPRPSADLMARLAADALREMPRPITNATRLAPGRMRWRDWITALGGWPAVGGLATATAVGVWIGATAPAGLADLAPAVWGENVSIAFGVDEDPLSLLEG